MPDQTRGFARGILDRFMGRIPPPRPQPPGLPKPPATSTPGTPQYELTKAQDDARNDPAFRPKRDGTTFCSRAVCETVKRMKGPMEALTYPNGEYAVSNDAARYLAEDAMVSSGRWRAVDDTAEAQQLANKGVVVVGVQRGALDEHGQRKHGHMVTVRPEQMPGFAEMTPFYRRDSRNLAVLVPDAWRRVLAESPPPPPLSGGEVWDGPHGYYAGDWYQMGAYEERIAYLAAYLWCLRTYGKQSATAYPRSLDYYDQRIWNYVETRKAYYEPAAEILARFRSAVPN